MSMHRPFILFVLFFVLCLFFVLPVGAQSLTGNVHALRPDTLTGELYVFADAGPAGKDVIWDFRSLTEPQETKRCISLVSPDDSSHLCVHERHARTYYVLQGDTLFCTGYENALTRMDYSCYEPVLRFPFGYGDTLSGYFSGTGEYCHRLPFTAGGHIRVEADGVGTLLLPDAKLKKDVLRLHRCRTWTEIAGSTADMQEDVWQWYVPQCPYPLLEAMRLAQRVEEIDSVLLSSVCVFQSVTDKDDEESPLQDEEELEDTAALLSDVSFLPNPVQTVLQISYLLASDAEVYVSVHYGGGVCMYRTPVVRETEGEHNLQLDMSAFPTGNYVLYIHADTETVGETVIKI